MLIISNTIANIEKTVVLRIHKFIPPRILLITSIFTSFKSLYLSRYNVFNQIEVVVFLLEALSSFDRLTPLSLQNYSNELDDTFVVVYRTRLDIYKEKRIPLI